MSRVALVLRPPSGAATRGMVRDFIYGCWCNGRRIGGMSMPPLAEAYVATCARQPGIDVQLLDAQIEPDRYKKLVSNKFQDVWVVLIMTSTPSYRDNVAVLKCLKTLNPKLKTVLFGSHSTFMPRYCLNENVVDFVVMGEPEETVRQLLRFLINEGGEYPNSVQGVGYRDEAGRKVINQPRPFVHLDDLPILDRSLLPVGVDYFNPVVKRMPYATVMTSRGCPGKCIFCTSPAFYGNKTRTRSADSVLEELRQLKSMGYKEIFFRDETFSAYRSRNAEICGAIIRENLDLTWIANARVDMVDKDSLLLMRRAGCHMVKFGVETASPEILGNYKKGTSPDQAREAFRLARNLGLNTHAHIVFGGPGETPETIDQTIRFVLELNPTTASFGILTPYPGSELFEIVASKHPEIRDGTEFNMENLHVSGFFSRSICGLDGQYLSEQVTRAYRRFYLRPSYLLTRLLCLRNYGEVIRTLIAGTYVLQFAVTGQK